MVAAVAVVVPEAAAAAAQPVAELPVGEPAAVRVVAELVELATAGLELVRRPELAALVAAGTVMMSGFVTPVHTDGFTRTTSERRYFVSKGAISLGLAAVGSGLVTLGLGAPFLVGITQALPTAVGRPGGRRRACAIPMELTTRSG